MKLPLIVFVHVPKTAGTTVRLVLNELSHRGKAFYQPELDLNINDLVDIDWITGHQFRDTFYTRIAWIARPVEYFSVVRHPKDRLISYLNFCLHRMTLPNHLSDYILEEQLFDYNLASTAFDNSFELKRLLLSYPDSLLNIQSRYLLGPDFSTLCEREIFERISSYTYIATEYTLYKLYDMFGFSIVPPSLYQLRSNESPRYFDPLIFDKPEMETFLNYHLSFDYKLYKIVKEFFHSCPQRIPIRPAYLTENIESDSEYFEEGYLIENPDVAKAIKDGELNDAYNHFVNYGKFEGRKIRKKYPSRG